MKIKKETIILVIVIVALSVYLVMRRSDQTQYELPVLSPVEKTKISKLQISKAGHSAALVREQDRWYLEGSHYPVEPAKADRMLNEVTGLTLTALVSESQSYERYGLDPGQALKIEAWADKTLVRSFVVGKTASTYRHTFVRVADGPKVYHARGNLRTPFDSSPSELRDKTVLSFEPAQIHEIRIVEEDKTITFARRPAPEAESQIEKDAEPQNSEADARSAKNIWVDASGQAISQERAEQLISDLSRLQCDHYLENRKKEDLKNPIIEIVLAGSQPYVLYIFEKNEEGYPAASSMNPDPFILPDYRLNSLKTDIQELGNVKAAEPKTSVNAG